MCDGRGDRQGAIVGAEAIVTIVTANATIPMRVITLGARSHRSGLLIGLAASGAEMIHGHSHGQPNDRTTAMTASTSHSWGGDEASFQNT